MAMSNLHPWLTNNCLRQAYLAFDLDAPGDLPQRPILQVVKIGTSTVTMANQKVATVKLQCVDGGMGQNTGVIFTQPDMLDHSRIHEDDFPLKIGMAMILLEFRVQQSPKTRLKYLRVSEMLIIDTMTHLISETPIHVRPPVAQSQLAHRESVPGENGTPVSPALGSHHLQIAVSAIPDPTTRQSPTFPSQLPQSNNVSPVRHFTQPTSSHYYQLPLPSQHYEGPEVSRVTASFGYDPSSPENIVALSALPSFKHASNIDCIGVVQSVFPVRHIGSINRAKRDVHIVDQSINRRVILSVWRYLDVFEPRVGDVLLLKKASVHRFDGGSLNAYENTEILVNSERADCVALREWWELKQLEETGCLNDLDIEEDLIP